jgi:hypothetical protein
MRGLSSKTYSTVDLASLEQVVNVTSHVHIIDDKSTESLVEF